MVMLSNQEIKSFITPKPCFRSYINEQNQAIAFIINIQEKK